MGSSWGGMGLISEALEGPAQFPGGCLIVVLVSGRHEKNLIIITVPEQGAAAFEAQEDQGAQIYCNAIIHLSRPDWPRKTPCPGASLAPA